MTTKGEEAVARAWMTSMAGTDNRWEELLPRIRAAIKAHDELHRCLEMKTMPSEDVVEAAGDIRVIFRAMRAAQEKT